MQLGTANTKQLKNNSHTIWLLTCLLTVLVIATAAVLGMCLYIYANPSDSKISLYNGEETEQTNQIIKNKGTSQNKSQAKTYQGTQAKQQAKKQGINVSDNTQVWTTDTEVELFKVSYKNNKGEITVKSAGNDKVIAPGTDGSYTFDLKNTSKQASDYKIWVETTISSNITAMPLQTRMSGAQGWMLGDKNNWKDAKDLDGISTTQQLDAGKSAQYTIYWQWPFEQGRDEEDTNLGNLSVGQEFTYKVVIHTLTTASTESGDKYSKDTNTSTKTDKFNAVTAIAQAIKTGDTAEIMKWAGILGLSAGIIFILLLWKKKKQKEEQA